MKNRLSDPAGTSRRNFLTAGTGALVTGAIAAGFGRGPAVAASESAPAGASHPAPAPAPTTAPALPWAYRELDVEVVRRHAYESYFKGSCCYAAADALLAALKENSGGPWATIPPEMFRFATEEPSAGARCAAP